MAERTGATFLIGYGLKVPEDADKVGTLHGQQFFQGDLCFSGLAPPDERLGQHEAGFEGVAMVGSEQASALARPTS